MKRISLNQIDIKYALSKSFNPKDYLIINKEGESDYRYGTKIICIANYILGLCSTNSKRGDHNFYHTASNTNVMLKGNESIIYYQHIANRFNCSTEWVRLIVKQLCLLKIINHIKDKSTGLWYFILIQIDRILIWLKQRKQIFYWLSKKKAITKVESNCDDPPPNDDIDDSIVNW